MYGGLQLSRPDEDDSKLATPQKKGYDVDKAQVSVDENQEEINTPRDDNLLTDGDILGSPIEFDGHINNNYNNEFQNSAQRGHDAPPFEKVSYTLNLQKKGAESVQNNNSS